MLKVYWTQVTNNMQAGPNVMQEILPCWRNPETFVIVSDVYPTVSAQAADLILPSAMWVEKEGAYGNAERRTQFWHQLVTAPARRARICGNWWSFPSASASMRYGRRSC